jgi:hypothetical protein
VVDPRALKMSGNMRCDAFAWSENAGSVNSRRGCRRRAPSASKFVCKVALAIAA